MVQEPTDAAVEAELAATEGLEPGDPRRLAAMSALLERLLFKDRARAAPLAAALEAQASSYPLGLAMSHRYRAVVASFDSDPRSGLTHAERALEVFTLTGGRRTDYKSVQPLAKGITPEGLIHPKR